MKIKKILLIVLVSMLSIQEAASQKVALDTIKKVDSLSGKIEQLNSKLDFILDKIQKGGDDEKQFIGVIKMKNENPIVVYDTIKSQENVSKPTVLVEKVTMLVKDGYIVDLNVYTKDEKFTNPRAPITISTRRFSKFDYLHGTRENSKSILLKDFLNFDSESSFLPEDGLIILTNEKKSDSLYRNVGLNTVLDLRLYTDALSLFGKVSNGIAQTDIKIKHILHRLNVKNTGGFLGHYFKFNLNAAKFDSKNNFIDSASFTKTSFLQKSWLNTEVAYNILSTWIERKSLSIFYFDIGAGINVSTLARIKDTITITGQNLFAEIGLNLKSSDNIGLDFYSRLTANYSPQTSFSGENKAEKILKFGIEAYWNPLKDRAGRIFGRVNYIMSTLNSEKKNHFFQVQLGYSLLLSKAIESGK